MDTVKLNYVKKRFKHVG